jgi:hypothetical protein
MKLQLARYTTPKGCKNQHVHPAAWSFVHWLPIYANTIYHFITLIQLLLLVAPVLATIAPYKHDTEYGEQKPSTVPIW